MGAFVIRRFFGMIVVLLVVSIVTFVVMHAIPGGPFDRDRTLPEEVLASISRRYHLDDPIIKQYVDYMNEVFVPRVTGADFQRTALNDYLINIGLPQGKVLRWMNFGPSYVARGRSVTDFFKVNLPVSMELGVYALMVSIVIGIPAGIVSALNRNTIYDYVGMSMAIIGVSIPVIILGPILQYILGVRLNLFPQTGWGTWKQAIMPAVALGFQNSALIARLTRASLLQVLNEDYIRTAHAKGLRQQRVIGVHAMKNAMIPVATIFGPLMAAVVTGTFVTELIFAIPGIGREFVRSIGNRDYPLIMGTTLLFAFFLVMANALVDITYAVLDPRIRID